MAGQHDAEKQQKVETLSIETRRLIGQAIIDGLLEPTTSVLLPGIYSYDPDYNQGQGDYTQRGGDHKQGGGNYNQAAITTIRDQLINVVRETDIRGQ